MHESPNIGARMQTFNWPSDLMTGSSINSSIAYTEKILQQADPDDSGQAINFITYDQNKGKCRKNSNVRFSLTHEFFYYIGFQVSPEAQ